MPMLYRSAARWLGVMMQCVLVVACAPKEQAVAPSGESPRVHREEPKPQQSVRVQLEHHVRQLSAVIGERNTQHPEALAAAADYVRATWEAQGLDVERQTYEVDGIDVENLAVTLPPADNRAEDAEEIVLIGAHYDSAPGTPGADDNATGVAALLALTHRFRERPAPRTLRLVAFVNEEPPFFGTEDMGSVRYATKSIVDRSEPIVAMFSLECLGYFSEVPGSQSYPPLLAPFFPDRGNFLAIVGNLASRGLVDQARYAFDDALDMPIEAVALPEAIPGIDWSDHASFWPHGVPAVMVTDTAYFRNPHYHEATDVASEIDFERLTRITEALDTVIRASAESVVNHGD